MFKTAAATVRAKNYELPIKHKRMFGVRAVKTLHPEIGIGAPAPVVWEVIGDLDGWAQWNPVMKASGVLAPGERINVTLGAPGGKAVSFDPVVVALEEGREFRWRTRKLLGMLDLEHGFRVVPEDTGRCRFEQFEVFRGILGGRVYSRQSKALDTGFQVMNRMLKREAETRARERA